MTQFAWMDPFSLKGGNHSGVDGGGGSVGGGRRYIIITLYHLENEFLLTNYFNIVTTLMTCSSDQARGR